MKTWDYSALPNATYSQHPFAVGHMPRVSDHKALDNQSQQFGQDERSYTDIYAPSWTFNR